MANYSVLKQAIQDVVRTNGNNEITGALLQQSLLTMVNSLGVGYQYAGIATPAINPGTPDQNVFYLASTAGTYTNFNNTVLADGEVAILAYNGSWVKKSTNIATKTALTELEQEVSLLKFTGMVDSGDIVIEQGSIGSSGQDIYGTTRLRIKDAIPTSVGEIAVPDGFLIQAVFYYSAWTDSSTYTYDTFVFVGAQSAKLDTTKNYARPIFRDTANNDIVPEDLIGGLHSVLPAITNLSTALKNLGKYAVSGTTASTYEWLADVYLEPGMVVKNTGSIFLNLYTQKSDSATYFRLELNEEITLSDTILAIRSINAAGAWGIEVKGDIANLKTAVNGLESFESSIQVDEVIKKGRSVSGNIASTYAYGQPFDTIPRGSLIRNNGDIGINCYDEVDGSYFTLVKGKIIITRQDMSVVRSRETAGNYSIEVYGTERVFPKNCYQFNGDIAANTTKELGQNSVKTFKRFALSAQVTNFDKLTISHGASSDWGSSWLEIDGTNIKVSTHTSSTTEVTAAHGLSISNDIQVTLQFDTDQVSITIQSQGERFEQSFNWSGANKVISVKTGSTTVLQDCAASWTCKGLTQPIWLFGDSYVSYANADRWPYYLFQDGHTDFLLNAYSGEDTAAGRDDLQNILIAGKPQFIVWCMGMNDPDSGVVNSTWKSAYDALTAFCDLYGITLILATIPNIPTRDNTYKNAIVRASGKRYIDFANAVGAETAGSSWYVGMLSSDGVHPTILGAKALYMRAVSDFPELLNT